MHVYVYDSFLNQKKYASLLAKIETRITDLGLSGKISRLGLIKNIKETVENEIKRGAKTIIAVGNDQTISEILPAMINTQIPLGVIPIDGPNKLSVSLGIESGERACDVLSARRIERLDLGEVNKNYFLSNLFLVNDGTIIEMNKDFTIEPIGEGSVNILNMATLNYPMFENEKSNPRDEKLELYIETKRRRGVFQGEGRKSFFVFKTLTIINTKNNLITIDGVKQIDTPAEVKILPKGINIIVGKNRTF